MNKETIALTDEQYVKIIQTIQSGFVCKDDHKVKPNNRIAVALMLEAKLGLRIYDILERVHTILQNRKKCNII